MVRHSNGNPITWQFLVVTGAMIVSIAGGSIWLAALSNQISVDSNRLNKIELFVDETQRHDANTTARIGPIENRLERLENWQSQMRQHGQET